MQLSEQGLDEIAHDPRYDVVVLSYIVVLLPAIASLALALATVPWKSAGRGLWRQLRSGFFDNAVSLEVAQDLAIHAAFYAPAIVAFLWAAHSDASTGKVEGNGVSSSIRWCITGLWFFAGIVVGCRCASRRHRLAHRNTVAD